MPFRAARALWFMGWIDKPQESDWREFLSLALAPLLLLAAVIAIAAALRNSKSLESLRLPTVSAKMFLWTYLAFFLISVLPRFGLVLTRTGFGWTQVTYLLAFCLTLFAFVRAGRTNRSGSDKLS
jgi:magnesium-transporting ATPase (P-type)